MGLRGIWLGGMVVACFCGAGAAPAVAGAESLTITPPTTIEEGKPAKVLIAGVADGSHRLYAYVDEAGRKCAPNPAAESERAATTVLSGAAGDVLAAGPFELSYTINPPGGEARFCAYLDETEAGPPDVVAAKTEDPVTEYLENQTPAQPTGTRTFTAPGAIEPQPVNQQVEEEFWAEVRAWEARGRLAVPAQGAELQITPGLEGGWVGWCLIVRAGAAAVPHCPAAPRAQQGIAYEVWEAGGPGTQGLALLNAPVEAVAVNYSHTAISPAPLSGMPGLGAVLVDIPAPFSTASFSLDEFEPVQHGFRASGERGWGHVERAYSAGLPASSWRAPRRPPAGACSITAVNRAGLNPRSGHVVRSLSLTPGISGDGFLSCIDTEYRFGHAVLDAAVLLDAARPGAAAPPRLPNAAPVRHHPGLFSAPGWNGQILARRVGEAWLAVEDGRSLRQRIQVLSGLRATVGG
jgi:hypothetical protein